jgi:hypothetical protein
MPLLPQLSDAVDKGWFRKRSSKREPNMEAILLTGGPLGTIEGSGQGL